MAASIVSGITSLANGTLTDPRPLLMNGLHSFEADTPNASRNVVTFNCNQSGSTINLATGTVPTASADNHTVYRLTLTSGSLPGGLTDGAFYFVGTVTSTSIQLRAATNSGTNSTSAAISITAATGTATLTAIGIVWNSSATFTFTAAAPYGKNSYVVGRNFTTPVDLSTGLLSVQYQFPEQGTNVYGYAVLIDVNGHWVRFRMADNTHLMLTPIQSCLFNVATDYTTLPGYNARSSAAFDKTQITKILAMNSTPLSGQRSACGIGTTIQRVTVAAHIGSGTIADAMAALIAANPGSTDYGNSVYRLGVPVQYGDDGVNTLALTGENATIFFPQRADGVNRFNFHILPNDFQLNIKLGAADSFALTNTQIKGIDSWVLDTSSSADPLAYNQSGGTIIGATVTLGSFAHSGMSFVSCPSVTQNGAAIDACNFTASPLTCDDPDTVTNCSFTSGGTGHGMVITVGGTHNLDSTFTGYGADGTTDAAIHNTYVGTTTLVIPVGVALPTVRNGAGATTVLMRPNFDLTITNLTNSYIAIDDDSDVQQSYDAALTGSKVMSVPYSETGNTWHVHIRRKGYAPRKIMVTFTGSDMEFDGALVQRLNFSGTATYTGTTSSDCQISLNDPATDEARIDLQGEVTAQIIYNMWEDAIVGSAAISSPLDAVFFQDPVGFQLLSMSSGLKLRRWHAGDTTAEAVGMFSQADNAPLDLTNGGVQFTGTPVLLTSQDVRDSMALDLSVGVVPATGSIDDKQDDTINLIEADEVHTPTTIEKRLKGTATVLLTKNWTGKPLKTFAAVD